MKIPLLLVGGFLLALTLGCGSTGAPQPPSLELPEPVKDLRAVRKGDRVTLTWTQPRQTTDEETARHLGATNICRTLAAAPNAKLNGCGVSVAEVQPQAVPKNSSTPVQMTFTDVFPNDLQESNPAGFATYAVEVTNHRGRSAGLSNLASVPTAPTTPAPSDVRAEVRGDGVYLSASGSPTATEKPGLQFAYRVYRHSVPSAPKETATVVAEIPAAQALQAVDRSFEWEKKYAYAFTPVTKIAASGAVAAAEVEGQDSVPVEVFAHDIFPPAAPTAVQAVYSGSPQQNFIDVTWAPNSENDLAGYNVYRHEGGAAAVKMNSELLKTPAFRDNQVSAGHAYFYAVTAVDLRNNESARSAETSETVPQSP